MGQFWKSQEDGLAETTRKLFETEASSLPTDNEQEGSKGRMEDLQ